MSLRLRTVGVVRVALCAAETDERPGDVYLDDGEHYALAAKFRRDWAGQTNDFSYPAEWAAMDTQKLRDAEQTLIANLAPMTDTAPPQDPPLPAPYQSFKHGGLGRLFHLYTEDQMRAHAADALRLVAELRQRLLDAECALAYVRSGEPERVHETHRSKLLDALVEVVRLRLRLGLDPHAPIDPA